MNNKELNEKLVDLLNEYQTLTNSQTEEISLLKLEIIRLHLLLNDEIKLIALFIKGNKIEEKQIINDEIKIILPKPKYIKKCRYCNQDFEGSKLTTVCKSCFSTRASERMKQTQLKIKNQRENIGVE